MLERWGHLAWLGMRILLAPLAIGMVTAPCGLALSNANAVQQQAARAVARALRIDASPEQIERNLQLLGCPPSLPPGSVLHLVSARAGFTPGTWLLRLDCSSRRDCLPFHALLRADIGLRSASADEWTAAALAMAQRSPGKPESSDALLARSGDHVQLVEELAGLRLQVKVVCLQSGALGERIRVQNPATHRVLLATIAGKDLVRVE